MLDRPILFVALNLLFYPIGLMAFGFKMSWVLMIVFMVIIILYNSTKVGVDTALTMAILYSTLFDSDYFTITSLKLRVWYILVLYLLAKLFFQNVLRKNWTVKNRELSIFVLMMFLLSAVHFLFDNLDGRLSNIKYWLFSVGLYYLVYKGLKPFFVANRKRILDFLISLNVFISAYGVFQFIGVLAGFGPRVMYDYLAIRPEAFFSETTWYGTYAAFGMVLIFLKYEEIKSNRILILLPINLVGLILSATRNTYFMIIALVFWQILMFAAFGDVLRIRKVFNRYVALLTIAILAIYVLNLEVINKYIDLILYKFQLKDSSATGRIDVIIASLKVIANNLFFGHGFDFNPLTEVTSSGASLGSKSFNLFLMIGHIYGLLGFLPFFGMIMYSMFKMLLKYVRTSDRYVKYAIILFTGYILMCMVAPLHQFPMGITIVATSSLFGADNLIMTKVAANRT